MNKRQHMYVTFVLSLFLYYYYFKFNFNDTLIYSLVTSLLAPIPDIDLKIVRFFNKIPTIIRAPLYLIELLVRSIFKHRTYTHNIFVASILLVLYQLYNSFIYILIFNAIIFHIIEDAMTVRGVKPFLPINTKIKIMNFSTSNNYHSIVINLICLLLFALFLYLL